MTNCTTSNSFSKSAAAQPLATGRIMRVCFPWLPEIAIEIYSAALVEANAFNFEKLSLSGRTLTREADRALRVHHTLPRDARPRRQCVHRVSDQARLTAQPRQSRDLPVSRDAPPRNA